MNENNHYCVVFPQNTSMEIRRKNNIGDVCINKAKCLRCNQIIISCQEDDMVTCSCGNLTVEGGSWHVKRSYKTNQWEECTVYYTDRYREIK